jgi:hypothetical protein
VLPSSIRGTRRKVYPNSFLTVGHTSALCSGQPEMAVRLSKVFGGSAESWLTQQAHYDLA